ERYPGRLQQRVSDQSDHRGHGNEKRIADLPSEQHAKGNETDRRRQPVADRDFSQEETGAEDRADRGGIGTLYKSLHVRVGPMPGQQRGRDEDEDERGQEDADRRGKRAPKAADKIPNEGGRDDHRARADHADGDGDQELTLIEPAVFLDEPL